MGANFRLIIAIEEYNIPILSSVKYFLWPTALLSPFLYPHRFFCRCSAVLPYLPHDEKVLGKRIKPYLHPSRSYKEVERCTLLSFEIAHNTFLHYLVFLTTANPSLLNHCQPKQQPYRLVKFTTAEPSTPSCFRALYREKKKKTFWTRRRLRKAEEKKEEDEEE